MHQTILTKLHSTPEIMLGRIHSGRSSIVCAFKNGISHPLWVAKTTHDYGSMWRLQREYEALTYLEPWAQQLCIPQVLKCDQGECEFVLILSGVPGRRENIALRVNAAEADLHRSFDEPIAWVRRFQSQVRAPQPMTLDMVANDYVERLSPWTKSSTAMESMIALLGESATAGSRKAVPVHADFHPTNVLFLRPGLSVIDWNSFASGFPLQDIFSFVVNANYYCPGRILSLLENYHHAFFSKSRLCEFVRSLIEAEEWSAPEARFLFYCFLATQICADASTPNQVWLRLVGYLSQHGWPGPGTPLESPGNS